MQDTLTHRGSDDADTFIDSRYNMVVKNRIKILYFITGLKTGGAEIVLYNLVKEIDKERFEPIMISILSLTEVGEKIKKSGIPVLSLNAKFKFNPFIFFRLLSILKKEKPIILHTFLFHTDFLGRIVGKFCKVPIIISSIRNEYIGGSLRERLLQFTDKFADVVVIVSQKVEEKMIKARVVSPQKSIVIYNGIDINKFKFQDEEKRKEIREKFNLKESNKVLISVGRLFKAKGYPYLIEAIKILKEKYPEIVLLILGEGEEREKLEKLIRKDNLDKNIFLLGRKENVADFLNVADVFVLSSLWEGFPNVILEAMACGLPVVATNVGGVEEIIEDNVSGFLVEPKNPSALAKKIEFVLNLNSGKRKEIGKKGRKTIEEKFSLGKMIKSYENLYEKLFKKLKNSPHPLF